MRDQDMARALGKCLLTPDHRGESELEGLVKARIHNMAVEIADEAVESTPELRKLLHWHVTRAVASVLENSESLHRHVLNAVAVSLAEHHLDDTD